MSRTRDEYQSIRLGDIDGFVVEYNTTTSVTITSGLCEANGEVYILASDTTKVISSAGDEFVYIYIDDSASTPPTPAFLVTSDPPSWSDSKRGFYYGNDRYIGTVWTNGSSQNIPFVTEVISPKLIRYFIDSNDIDAIASSMNPTGVWQTPNVTQSSSVVPVTATEIRLQLRNSDAGSIVNLAAASNEFATLVTNYSDAHYQMNAGEFGLIVDWLPLGASRNIKIAGADNDDNGLTAECAGFGILR